MITSLLILAVSIATIAFAGKLVNRAIVTIARYFEISEFTVALFMVALSTSLPELFVGISAAFEKNSAVALGNIFGSNIVNMSLIAGLVVVFGRKVMALESEFPVKQSAFIFVASSIPLVLLLDGKISSVDGLVLLSAFVFYFWYISRQRRKLIESVQVEKDLLGDKVITKKRLALAIGLFAVGIALLLGGAHLVVRESVLIAGFLHVPMFFIGLFLVAVGTSVPELAYGIYAAISKKPELGVSNVLGSSTVNSLLILGVVSIINPIETVAKASALFSGLYMIFVFGLFYLMIRKKNELHPMGGALLILSYIFFVFVQMVFFV